MILKFLRDGMSKLFNRMKEVSIETKIVLLGC